MPIVMGIPDIAEEKSLSDGIEHERNLYFLTFATADQKEGAKSFVEKREPGWKHC